MVANIKSRNNAITIINLTNTTLGLVLAPLSHAGLILRPKKCILAFSEIPFWGFQVTAQGLTPDPQKVEAVQHAEHP